MNPSKLKKANVIKFQVLFIARICLKHITQKIENVIGKKYSKWPNYAEDI